MPEDSESEGNPTEAGGTGSAESARTLIRKTKRATLRRFPTEDNIRIVMEGIHMKVSVMELCRHEKLAVHMTRRGVYR